MSKDRGVGIIDLTEAELLRDRDRIIDLTGMSETELGVLVENELATSVQKDYLLQLEEIAFLLGAV